jgi:hypothetical protein
MNARNKNRLNKAFLAGERIPGIKFRHNSLVSFVGEDGVRYEGWIVAAALGEPDPIYTVERRDGAEDTEVREANCKLILDPHDQ